MDGQLQRIPVLSLDKILTYNTDLPACHAYEVSSNSENIYPIIIIRDRKRLIGIEVDRLLGEQELVISPLGDMPSLPTYTHGFSILPDSRLCLVLDGVALVRKIAHKMGEPSAHPNVSTSNQGITAETSSGHKPSVSQAKPTILVIDDSVTVRNTLTNELTKVGYQVVQAKEGADVFSKTQTHSCQAFPDRKKWQLYWFEFLKRRQKIPAMKSIPTIMLTSRTGVKHRQLAQELGAVNYLTKPYSTPHLLKALTEALH